MQLPTFERTLCGAIKVARYVKGLYVELGNAHGANVSPGLVDVVAKYRNKAILWRTRPYAQSISICLRHPERYDIIIPSGFNHCHQRFALCKELCHILTDDVGARITDPTIPLLQAIQSSRAVRLGVPDLFFGTLNSEDFCFLLALEFLIPWGARDEIVRRLDGGDNSYDIAYQLRIPQTLVDFFHKSRYHMISKLVCRDVLPGNF